jgi:hypothetical protein
MAKFPQEISMVNRCSVTITPTETFLGWVNEVDPMNIIIDDIGGRTYLLPDNIGDNYDIKEFVDKHFRFFFEYELNSWYADSTLWPKRLTRKMFYEWFDVESSELVYDTVNQFLEKE